MTPSEMIAVIQAAKDGKKIECRRHGSDLWIITGHPKWNFAEYDYRVAEEPPKLVPHWPAIRSGSSLDGYYVTDQLFPTEGVGKARWGLGFIRLATEYPPIMLEVKE